MKYIVIGLCVVFILSCGKDSPPAPPEAAILSFPLQNSECTTGIDVNPATSEVEFRWQTSKETETYELRVTNLSTSVTQAATTGTTTAKLPLEKGAPHSWQVLSRNSKTQNTATSASWQFYNAGSATTYAPFPASLENPKSGSSVLRDVNDEIELRWFGADVDNDITGYEVYLDTMTPPEQVETSISSNTTSIRAGVDSNEVYYWKVITTDAEGNTSDSGIFSFRVL